MRWWRESGNRKDYGKCQRTNLSNKRNRNRKQVFFMRFSMAKTSGEDIQTSHSLSTIASSLLPVCNEG